MLSRCILMVLPKNKIEKIEVQNLVICHNKFQLKEDLNLIRLLIPVSNSVLKMSFSWWWWKPLYRCDICFYFTGNPVSFVEAFSVRHQCNVGEKDSCFWVLWWNGKIFVESLKAVLSWRTLELLSFFPFYSWRYFKIQRQWCNNY